jgi:hypothetical protein
MVWLTGVGLLIVLGWLSLPPRGERRWALLSGLALIVAWLLLVAWQRGLTSEFGHQGPLWLVTLALLGAPMLQLVIWSAVNWLVRPRAERGDSRESEAEQ